MELHRIHFVDTLAFRGVISWFNRQPLRLAGANANGVGINGTFPVDLGSTYYVSFVACRGRPATARSRGHSAISYDRGTGFLFDQPLTRSPPLKEANANYLYPSALLFTAAVSCTPGPLAVTLHSTALAGKALVGGITSTLYPGLSTGQISRMMSRWPNNLDRPSADETSAPVGPCLPILVEAQLMTRSSGAIA